MDASHPKVDPQQIDVGCSAWKIQAAQAAIKQNIVGEEHPIVLFYNLKLYKESVARAKAAFPSFFLHTMAVKSNPVSFFMEFCRDLGLGFESASLGELMESLHTGIDPQKIVFDSPVKTQKELEFSLQKGVYVNLDNFQELDRVDQLIATGKFPKVNVGIRLNPQVGEGTIKEMSTASDHSKFGIALKDYHDKILNTYITRPWLNGIHVHVGSQGCPLELMLNGIRRTVDLALEVNKQRGSQQIQFIDIGGGLPVNFDDEKLFSEGAPDYEYFSKKLQEKIPELYTGDYKVITEFGRTYNAKPGFIISKVEYNKVSGGRNIASIHGGADIFGRTVYMPTKWAIRVSVLSPTGELKQGPRMKQDIAGPCCFAADVIAHERELPLVEMNDHIIAHDTGGYYYSNFAVYNSRQAPPIYVIDEDPTQFKLVKKGQTVEDTLKFFECIKD